MFFSTSVPGEFSLVRGAPKSDGGIRKISHAYELVNSATEVVKRATLWITIPTGNLTAEQVAVDRVQVLTHTYITYLPLA